MSLQELYIILGAVGLISLLASIFLGDADFDVGDVDIDVEGGLSDFLNLKSISAGLVGFGVVGVVIRRAVEVQYVVFASAIAGFIAFACLSTLLIVRPLARQQSNTLVGRQSYFGTAAVVTVGIQSEGFGQVEFPNANKVKVTERAKTADGSSVPSGQEVLIVEVMPDHVIVAIAD